MHIVLFTLSLVSTILTFVVVKLALEGPSRSLFLVALQASVALQAAYLIVIVWGARKERARRSRGAAGTPSLS